MSKPNVSDIIGNINMLGWECRNMRNDGWTSFGYKQDLYLIKEALDLALKDAPTFVGEGEWLHEQEQKRIIKILKS
jgi:hypothetical protein